MLGHFRFVWVLALISCAGPEVVRLETEVGALTQRVQALEDKTKKLDAALKRANKGAKTGKGVKGGKAGKTQPPAKGGKGKGAKTGKTRPPGTEPTE